MIFVDMLSLSRAMNSSLFAITEHIHLAGEVTFPFFKQRASACRLTNFSSKDIGNFRPRFGGSMAEFKKKLEKLGLSPLYWFMRWVHKGRCPSNGFMRVEGYCKRFFVFKFLFSEEPYQVTDHVHPLQHGHSHSGTIISEGFFNSFSSKFIFEITINNSNSYFFTSWFREFTHRANCITWFICIYACSFVSVNYYHTTYLLLSLHPLFTQLDAFSHYFFPLKYWFQSFVMEGWWGEWCDRM